jgi:hypothetical protein
MRTFLSVIITMVFTLVFSYNTASAKGYIMSNLPDKYKTLEVEESIDQIKLGLFVAYDRLGQNLQDNQKKKRSDDINLHLETSNFKVLVGVLEKSKCYFILRIEPKEGFKERILKETNIPCPVTFQMRYEPYKRNNNYDIVLAPYHRVKGFKIPPNLIVEMIHEISSGFMEAIKTKQPI